MVHFNEPLFIESDKQAFPLWTRVGRRGHNEERSPVIAEQRKILKKDIYNHLDPDSTFVLFLKCLLTR